MALTLDVLIFGNCDDGHSASVANELLRLGRSVGIWSASDLNRTELTWVPGEGLSMVVDEATTNIDRATSVWWRRPGIPTVSGLSTEEAQLVYDEVADILPGLAVSETGRCVDDPWVIDRAANKLLQLSTAKELGITIPTTVVTNSRGSKNVWPKGHQIIAKALSSGVGLAPFAAQITPQDWDFLESCPTQLQAQIDAASDLRVVTIGSQVVAWKRDRSDREPLDWRMSDPTGTEFILLDGDPTEGLANKMSRSLNLTFSVQDWLLTKDPVFLEVNPQGQWLFLDLAAEVIPPLLAKLLLGELDGE
ncbi:MAG: hypothetical protein F4Z02_07215 [Acidimicrobiia bacterium]|nr:hypothetical protein [Acidimicrobiia bacterium]MYG73015.1 hypothetical protein [Acidimicrobiia bacterium]